MSPGQAAEPVQLSATSHTPLAERQTVLVGRKVLLGQLPDEPVQFSAASHTPAAERQTVLEGRNVFDGQALAEPVQVSALSHTPDAERQTVPDALKLQVARSQHGLVSSHCSAPSTAPLPHTLFLTITSSSNWTLFWSIALIVSVSLPSISTSV